MSARSRGHKRQPEPCLIKGCDSPVLAKHLCSRHYQRQWSTGNPLRDGEEFDLVKLLAVDARSRGLTP